MKLMVGAGVDSLDDRKLCQSCAKIRILSDFHQNKSKADGRQANCKRCVATMKKKKYLKKKKEVRFSSKICGCLDNETIVSFSDVFSESILTLVDDGKI